MSDERNPVVHLVNARKQLERVQIASNDPSDDDHEVAVTWAFYAYENAVTAAGLKAGMKWSWNDHRAKSDIAKKLHETGVLSLDVSDKLSDLNRLRKDVQYGVPGWELLEIDLEDLATDLEALLDEVTTFVETADED